VAAIWLLVATILFPVGFSTFADSPGLFPFLSSGAAVIGTMIIAVAVILVLHTLIQLIMPPILFAMARARQARPRTRGYYEITASAFHELTSASAVPERESR
jgi:uncharacterized membrane-anchored protein